ncbi:oligopeptide transporter [Tanacetum coccineum]|uniref:Oligopeptide transporter n=1 Tax=Tanacetum coccineum TaxID=301880 RepID=A0ABQ5ER66_9ASTR
MDFEEMVSYLKRKITRQFTHLYYALPPNNTSMKSIKSDYDTDVMYDIAKVAGKIQIYVSRHPVDLSTELIPNDDSLEEAYAGVISEETKIKQQESLSCTPNSLGDMTVTLKDPTGVMGDTIHYKVFQKDDGYTNSIKVGSVLILRNVSVFTPKPSKHYLNITIRNIVKI